MSLFLKQSTSRTIVLGPFVDDADGKTAEGSLTIAQADVRLTKNAGTYAQKNDATSCTHMENGYYSCPLNTTDTDTLGSLRVSVAESGALPVWEDFNVVTANVYDAMFSTGTLNANVTQISGDSTAADNAESFFDGTGYAGTGNTIPTVTTVGTATAVTTVNGLAANSVTASALATDAVTEIQSGLATSASISALNNVSTAQVQTSAAAALTAYDPPTHAELTSGLASADDAVLAAVAALNNLSAAQVNAEVDSALADYDGPTNAEMVARTLAAADYATATNLGTVDTVVDSIKVDTAAILSDTGTDGVVVASGSKTGYTLSTTGIDAILTRPMTEDYSSVGGDLTILTALYELVQHMQEAGLVGTTWTINERDGTTPAFTLTIDDATTPTAVERAT